MKNIPAYVATIMLLCAASGFAAAEDYGHDEANSWGRKGGLLANG